MSEETDVEIEKVPENKDTDSSKPDISQNPVEVEEITEDETLAESKDEATENEGKDLENKHDDEGPPCVIDDEDRWPDSYQFPDDEKLVIDYNEKDPQKLILLAAQNNELDILRKLLEADPSLVNARDNDLYTPLHRASYSNNVEVIRILLSYDADIHAKTIDDWEPLHCACKWDSVEAVSVLIQNGADVNAQSKGHVTPLHLAAANLQGRRTLELLLWHPHIDPNIQNDGGDTAYDIACRSGPLGALFEILEESVNVY